jgi:hypothetical protein
VFVARQARPREIYKQSCNSQSSREAQAPTDK